MTHYYRVRKWMPERYWLPCRVLVPHSSNGNILIQFSDDVCHVVSRWSVRRLKMQHEEKLFKVGKINLPGRRYTGAFIRPSGAQGYGDVIQDQQTAELFVVYVSGYDRPNPTFVEYTAVVRVCLDQSTAVCKLRRFRADLSKKPVSSFIGDTVELLPEWEYLREQNPWTHSKAPKTWADLEKLSPVNPLNHEQSK